MRCRAGRGQDRGHRLRQFPGRSAVGGPPGDVAVGADQDGAVGLDFAEVGPGSVRVAQPVAGADAVHRDRQPGEQRGLARRIVPALAAGSGEQHEPAVPGHVQRRAAAPPVLQPGVRQPRARPRGRPVVQLGVAVLAGLGRAVGNGGAGAVAVAEFDTVGVGLAVDRGRGRRQRRAPLPRLGGVVVQGFEQLPLLPGALSGGEAERARDAGEVEHAAERPVHDLPPDRLPFGLVGVEQPRPRRSVEDQLELPAEVEGVRDGRVEPQAVGRRVLVDGVADAEHASVRVAGCDRAVDLPGGDVPDGDVDGRVADALADAGADGLVVVLVDLLGGRGEGEVEPFVPGPQADEDPAVRGVVAGDRAHVEQGGPVGGVAGEVGLEPGGDGPRDAGVPLQFDPDLPEHPAPGPVGSDQVVGAHGVLPPRTPVGDRRRDAVLVLFEGDELVAEAQLPDARLLDGLHEDRFQQVLRQIAHRGGAGRPVLPHPVGAVAVGVDAGHFRPGEGGHEHVVGHGLAGHRAGPHAVLDAEVAQDLAGALVDQVRPRRVGGAEVAVHQQVAYSVAREGQGSGQAGGPAAGDEHRDPDVRFPPAVTARHARSLPFCGRTRRRCRRCPWTCPSAAAGRARRR